jgi:hypothetical protein
MRVWWSVAEVMAVYQGHPSTPTHGRPHPGRPVAHMRIEEFIFEGLKGVVVQVKLHLECPIGHTSPALQHGQRLVKNLLKGHHQPSVCATGHREPCEDGRCRQGIGIPQMTGKGKQEIGSA